jgi:hypothetical protein
MPRREILTLRQTNVRQGNGESNSQLFAHAVAIVGGVVHNRRTEGWEGLIRAPMSIQPD